MEHIIDMMWMESGWFDRMMGEVDMKRFANIDWDMQIVYWHKIVDRMTGLDNMRWRHLVDVKEVLGNKRWRHLADMKEVLGNMKRWRHPVDTKDVLDNMKKWRNPVDTMATIWSNTDWIGNYKHLLVVGRHMEAIVD